MPMSEFCRIGVEVGEAREVLILRENRMPASVLCWMPASVSQGRASTRNNYLQLPAFRYPAAWASDSESKVIWFFADT
jgi:hypothetical protein